MKNHSIEDIEHRFINQYSKMMERINLQSIGYCIREGSILKQVNETSFSERAHNAETRMEKELYRQLGQETAESILSIIYEYTSTKEEIQFSLGMKAGAKIALLLTGDFDKDY